MIKYNKHKNANFQSPVTILSEKGSFDPFDPVLTPGDPKIGTDHNPKNGTDFLVIVKVPTTHFRSQTFSQLKCTRDPPPAPRVSKVLESPNLISYKNSYKISVYQGS